MLKTLAMAWLGVVVSFALVALMWLYVNAPGALVYLAVFFLAAVVVFFTLWALITLAQKEG